MSRTLIDGDFTHLSKIVVEGSSRYIYFNITGMLPCMNSHFALTILY
nr:MAG TPA: hypothetical protein [Bacteriophage sp.]